MMDALATWANANDGLSSNLDGQVERDSARSQLGKLTSDSGGHPHRPVIPWQFDGGGARCNCLRRSAGG